MTKEIAAELGYKIIEASPVEFGLLKNEEGIRTWWKSTFEGKMPELDNKIVQAAIQITESIREDIE